MVNNNNLNLTKEQKVNADSSAKSSSATLSSQRKEEDIGFKELYEQSLNQLQYGDIARGKVVQIANEMVMVDVGWKHGGFFPGGGLREAEGNINISGGDEVEG